MLAEALSAVRGWLLRASADEGKHASLRGVHIPITTRWRANARAAV